MYKTLKQIINIPRNIVVLTILLYQKTISPDHSWLGGKLFPRGYCKYEPTCSHYTRVAINYYGVIKGAYLGTKRVFRCVPWSQGGFDPVPGVPAKEYWKSWRK